MVGVRALQQTAVHAAGFCPKVVAPWLRTGLVPGRCYVRVPVHAARRPALMLSAALSPAQRDLEQVPCLQPEL